MLILVHNFWPVNKDWRLICILYLCRRPSNTEAVNIKFSVTQGKNTSANCLVLLSVSYVCVLSVLCMLWDIEWQLPLANVRNERHSGSIQALFVPPMNPTTQETVMDPDYINFTQNKCSYLTKSTLKNSFGLYIF